MIFKNLSKKLLLCAAVFLLTSITVSAQDNYSDLDPNTPPDTSELPDNAIEEILIENNVIFTDDRALFTNSCTNLAFEGFEDTDTAPGSIVTCPNPFNNATGNACFNAGALIPGFSMNAINPPDDINALVVITPPALGFTNTAAGANTFLDNLSITFDGFVNAVGLQVITLIGPVEVQVFSGDDLIGSVIVNVVSADGTFLGIASSERQITRVELVNGFGDLLYDLSFGSCSGFTRAIPTISEWGLIAMAVVLAIIGLLAIQRKKATT